MTWFDLAFDWLTALCEFFVGQSQHVEHVLSLAAAGNAKDVVTSFDLAFDWLTSLVHFFIDQSQGVAANEQLTRGIA